MPSSRKKDNYDGKAKKSSSRSDCVLHDEDVWFESKSHPGTKAFRRAIRFAVEDYENDGNCSRAVYKSVKKELRGRTFFSGKRQDKLREIPEDELIDRIGDAFRIEHERRLEKRQSKRSLVEDSTMSSSCEVNAQPDVWMDINSKEEVLQNELTHVKEELKTRSKEREEATSTVHELKYNLNSVEFERDTLQTDLKHSKNCLSRVRNELEETNYRKDFIKDQFGNYKTASERQKEKLEKELGLYRNELEGIHDQIMNLNLLLQSIKIEQEEDRKEANGTIEGLNKLINELKGTLSNQHQTSKQQQESIARKDTELKESHTREEVLRQELAREKQALSARSREIEEANEAMARKDMELKEYHAREEASCQDLASEKQVASARSKEIEEANEAMARKDMELKEFHAREEALRQELAREKQLSSARSKEIEEANERVGTITVLVEDLKVKQLSLERSLAQQDQALDRVNKELNQSRGQVASVIPKLPYLKDVSELRTKDLESSVMQKQQELQEACAVIANLEASVTDFKRETVYLKNAHDDLEDSLVEKQRDLGEACELIRNLKASLAELVNETKTMQKEQDEKCAREEALRKELVEQNIAHEQRLQDIKEDHQRRDWISSENEISASIRSSPKRQKRLPRIDSVGDIHKMEEGRLELFFLGSRENAQCYRHD